MPTARSRRPSEVKGRSVAATISEFDQDVFNVVSRQTGIYLPIFVLFTLPWPGLLYSAPGAQHLVKYFRIRNFRTLTLV